MGGKIWARGLAVITKPGLSPKTKNTNGDLIPNYGKKGENKTKQNEVQAEKRKERRTMVAQGMQLLPFLRPRCTLSLVRLPLPSRLFFFYCFCEFVYIICSLPIRCTLFSFFCLWLFLYSYRPTHHVHHCIDVHFFEGIEVRFKGVLETIYFGTSRKLHHV